MNKPAPKEPSMDEILSSIRQIIADDDASVTARRPTFQSTPAPMAAKPAAIPSDDDVVTPLRAPAEPISFDIPGADDEEEEAAEPLTLSMAQMLPIDVAQDDEPAESAASAANDFSVDALLAEVTAQATAQPLGTPNLVDPEDVAFEAEEAESVADAAFVEEAEEMVTNAAVANMDDMTFDEPVAASAAPAFEPPAAAELPDPTLSAHLAEKLLEPTTEAVVRSSFSRLNPLPLGNQGATVESMMREMLRPMLKEWLDENLPTIVERMVEKEISRVSRGVE